jgi:hypothetical protein
VPFWARENSRPGRWHQLGDEPTQYWSLTPEAAWAELIHHEHIRSESELDLVRMPFWACRFDSGGIVDLRREDVREQYEITEALLVARDWTACQSLRPRLANGLARGVIAPSACLPSHANVTLFGPRRAISWTKAPALASTVPTAQVALGRPPIGVLAQLLPGETNPMQDTLF